MPLFFGAVALLETRDPATGVEDFLLTCEERVALVANLGMNLTGGSSATSLKSISTGARDSGGHVLRVNVFLHGSLQSLPGPVTSFAPVNRKPALNCARLRVLRKSPRVRRLRLRQEWSWRQ